MSTRVTTNTGIMPCCGVNQTQNSWVNRQLQPKQTDVESMLVQGMNELSFQDRQRQQEDLHGIVEAIDKEEQVVNALLQQMKVHLQEIKAETAYGKAEMRNPDYVHRRDFEIIFLRGNRNDPKAAAEQMIRYYDLKQELFGEELLTRDITSEDLSEEDKGNFLNGSVQTSNCYDMAGRIIAWGLPGLRPPKVDVMSELRARFYFGTNLVESADDPSRGIVMVTYNVGRYDDHTKGAGFKEGIKLSLAMPMNIAGFHLCFSNRAQSIMARAAVLAMPAHLRAKTKVHFGSHFEVQYYLSTYGIPRQALPFDLSSNEADLTACHRWYQECRMKEMTNRQQTINGNGDPMAITPVTSPTMSAAATPNVGGNDHNNKSTPNENDVLCIGRRVNGQKGNERLISLATLHAHTYDTGSPKERKMVVNIIMEEIWSHGGRFLQVDANAEGSYVEVPDKVMQEKICQTFRNLRYRKQGLQKQAAAGSGGSNTTTAYASFSGQTSNNSNHPAVIVHDLQPQDVLFGKVIQNHPGNEKLKELVESMSSQYDNANRGDKKVLSDGLVTFLKEHGARFLRQLEDGQSWEVVSDKIAEKKIAAHFRNIRRKQRK